ncbi:hypothetical protein BLNAU_13371 [Blattamonas nauphoetae]|uniref:Uncharacterized protein n=1 Tax=Blattamonas nauphoetae TaxID=2049346 RepID=A0ABQ9XJQ5_9EUKA|nr:hypothetical protein BLNAU_13371 [Blattamonas nauphoetae]
MILPTFILWSVFHTNATSDISTNPSVPNEIISHEIPLHELKTVPSHQELPPQQDFSHVKEEESKPIRNMINESELTKTDHLKQDPIAKIKDLFPSDETATNQIISEPVLEVKIQPGSGQNHAWIEFSDPDINEGTYTVTLVGITGFSFDVTFSGATGPNGWPLSEPTLFRLFGVGSSLTFMTEYRIASFINNESQQPLDLNGMSVIFFTPPATARIVEMGQAELIGDQKDEISISLTGVNLLNTKYFIETDPSSLVDGHKLSAVFDDQTGTIVAKVYSTTESEVHLQYGQKYEVLSITDKHNTPILFDHLSFTVPPSPIRITSLSIKLSDDKSQALVTLTGVNIPASPVLFINLKNPTTNLKLRAITSYQSDTCLFATIPAAQSEWTSSVAFNTSYEIVSIASEDNLTAAVVKTGLKVDVPAAPIVSFVQMTNSSNYIQFKIDMLGSDLPKSGVYTMTLNTSAKVPITFKDGTGSSDWMKDGDCGLHFNTTYYLATLAKGNDQIIVNQRVFSTPTGPTLTSIDPVSFKGEDMDIVVLTLNGYWIPIAADVPSYDLVVQTGTDPEVTIPVSFSTLNVGSGEAKVFNPSDLKYDTHCTVVRLTSTFLTVRIPSPVTFKTPVGPVRLLSAKCNLDTASGKSAEIVLAGDSFPAKTSFKLTVFELDSSSAKVGNAFELSSSFLEDGSASSHTLSLLIYGEPLAKLKSNTSYLIVDLQISGKATIVSNDVTFDVPPEPARLTGTAFTVDDSVITSTLVLSSRQLLAGQTYIVYLSGTPIQPSNSNSVHTLDFEVIGAPSITKELTLYPTSTLLFNHHYEVTSMTLKSSSKPAFVESASCSFSTPEEPTRIETATYRLNSEWTKLNVILTGRVLKSGTYSLTFTHSDNSKTRIIEAKLNSNNNLECSPDVSDNSATGLLFGATYSVTAATLDGTSVLVNSGIDIEVTRHPKVTAVTIHPNTHNTAVTIELSGTGLATMKEYTVTLRPSFSYKLLFDDTSRALSPTLRIDTSDGLDPDTEYFVESIVGVVDSDDIILIDGSVSFKTPKPMLIEAVVSSSGVGGGEGEECGSLSSPCGTLFAVFAHIHSEGIDLQDVIKKYADDVTKIELQDEYYFARDLHFVNRNLTFIGREKHALLDLGEIDVAAFVLENSSLTFVSISINLSPKATFAQAQQDSILNITNCAFPGAEFSKPLLCRTGSKLIIYDQSIGSSIFSSSLIESPADTADPQLALVVENSKFANLENNAQKPILAGQDEQTVTILNSTFKQIKCTDVGELPTKPVEGVADRSVVMKDSTVESVAGALGGGLVYGLQASSLSLTNMQWSQGSNAPRFWENVAFSKSIEVKIVSCKFSSSGASSYMPDGGVLYLPHDTAKVKISNSTISHSTTPDGHGAVIYTTGRSTITVQQCVIDNAEAGK